MKRKGYKRNTSASEEDSSDSEQLDDYVKNCIRYILLRSNPDLPIHKADLQKTIPVRGKKYEEVIEVVSKTLLEVYGLKFEIDCTSKNKTYFLYNTLPYVKDETKNTNVNLDAIKVLNMLILAHIFMSNRPVTQNCLNTFLNALDIYADKNHLLIGNVKDQIKIMVKQKILNVYVSGNEITYGWGPRAEATISKHELLKFVCKIYKNCSPNSWSAQLQAASEQFAQNNNGEDMQES